MALTSDSARAVWQQALSTLGDLLAEQASFAEEVANTAQIDWLFCSDPGILR